MQRSGTKFSVVWNAAILLDNFRLQVQPYLTVLYFEWKYESMIENERARLYCGKSCLSLDGMKSFRRSFGIIRTHFTRCLSNESLFISCPTIGTRTRDGLNKASKLGSIKLWLQAREASEKMQSGKENFAPFYPTFLEIACW